MLFMHRPVFVGINGGSDFSLQANEAEHTKHYADNSNNQIYDPHNVLLLQRTENYSAQTRAFQRTIGVCVQMYTI